MTVSFWYGDHQVSDLPGVSVDRLSVAPFQLCSPHHSVAWVPIPNKTAISANAAARPLRIEGSRQKNTSMPMPRHRNHTMGGVHRNDSPVKSQMPIMLAKTLTE